MSEHTPDPVTAPHVVVTRSRFAGQPELAEAKGYSKRSIEIATDPGVVVQYNSGSLFSGPVVKLPGER